MDEKFGEVFLLMLMAAAFVLFGCVVLSFESKWLTKQNCLFNDNIRLQPQSDSEEPPEPCEPGTRRRV